jgi:hypothetical protein
MKMPSVKRTDLMFVLGAGLIIGEALGPEIPNNGLIVAGLALMGVSVGSRLKGNGKDGDDTK